MDVQAGLGRDDDFSVLQNGVLLVVGVSAPEKSATLSLFRTQGGNRKVLRMAQIDYIKNSKSSNISV